MAYLGSWKIDDALYFYANTQAFATGVATDADAEPTYRIYENETGTALLNGTLSLLDSANTAGLYSETVTLSAANGFEKGKQYVIYKSATVSGVVGASHDTFQIEAEVDANVVSGAVTVATGGIPAAAFAAGAIDAAALNASAVDEILDDTIGDSTLTLRQAIRVLIAASAGKLSGAATTTVVIRNVADDTDVITATVDADGNRTAVVVAP